MLDRSGACLCRPTSDAPKARSLLLYAGAVQDGGLRLQKARRRGFVPQPVPGFRAGIERGGRVAKPVSRRSNRSSVERQYARGKPPAFRLAEFRPPFVRNDSSKPASPHWLIRRNYPTTPSKMASRSTTRKRYPAKGERCFAPSRPYEGIQGNSSRCRVGACPPPM